MAATWQELKAAGNAAYSGGDLDEAIAKYTAALQTDVGAADRGTLLCNRAQCYLKQDKFTNAIEDCTACLAVAPDNVKALFRRSVLLRHPRPSLATQCSLLQLAVPSRTRRVETNPRLDQTTMLS